ncbi:MAG: hypothetical protein JWM11_7122 [Planctomycetaceae bacterium]|nr:hypothetical protein [Planctomycetaceae bacterium]
MDNTKMLKDQGCFLAYGPYGPVYIEFELVKSAHDAEPGSLSNLNPKLSANGWPVQRVEKGRYRVFASDKCIEVVSDQPKAI